MARRQQPRVISPVAVVDGEGGAEYQSGDLSATGMFVTGASSWPLGSCRALRIKYLDFDISVVGRVVRCDSRGAAVVFEPGGGETKDQVGRLFHGLLSDTHAPIDERRRAPRRKVAGTIVWKHLGVEHLNELSDLSMQGASVVCHDSPEPGTQVEVSLPALTGEAGRSVCAARVARQLKNGFAVSFINPSGDFRAAIMKQRR